jgi:hypothetical protein
METSFSSASDATAWAEQFAQTLSQQREQVREFLAAKRTHLEQAEILIEKQLDRRNNNDRDWDDDLDSRYDLAMEELSQLKSNNSELQQQLARTRSTAAKLAQQARQPGCLDWEAEKQRILAALEADVDGADEAQRSDRLKSMEVIRKTNEVIATKDREIQELKEQLAEGIRSSAAKVSDIAVIDHVLDNDFLIQEERQRLKQLQEEWRGKVREAEIELSVERANMARQRAELEELRKNQIVAPATPTDSNKPAEPSTRGRWLAKLGLTAADRELPRHL